MTDHSKVRKITIMFARRDDGGLRAHSDDVPEFYLAGRNPQEVLDDVIPAMECILRINYNEQLKVSASSDLDAVARELGLLPDPTDHRPTQRGILSSATAEYIGVAA